MIIILLNCKVSCFEQWWSQSEERQGQSPPPPETFVFKKINKTCKKYLLTWSFFEKNPDRSNVITEHLKQVIIFLLNFKNFPGGPLDPPQSCGSTDCTPAPEPDSESATAFESFHGTYCHTRIPEHSRSSYQRDRTPSGTHHGECSCRVYF